ncbi:hypothetical protein RI129_012369 [Pyrocoelia pectoralis]|uniref:Ketosynthase family 3 (KS3) domain-containing protein n=1 Tax=Pyrocoelia pectoralis TaxID=417401 RepID=A0AAN7V757_9COLE
MVERDSLQYGKTLASPLRGNEVVITGISGRFPQSDNVNDLFKNLMYGKDLLTECPEEWNVKGNSLPPRMGRLNGRHKFDSGFFGVNYHQAEILHPACRMLLETTVEAIIDAGFHPSDLKGTKTGVFIGGIMVGYELPWNQYERGNFEMNWLSKGSMAERISYHLGLEGPAMYLDTACNSSGYAMEHAFTAIRSGQCDCAIVGGINVIFTPHITSMLLKFGFLDPDAENNVFDENAKGYVRSEGICVVILQKLNDSKRVYAQIVHTKTNIDGYKETGLLHPSGESKAVLYQELYQEAGLNCQEVNFVEVHSTGTKAGDPEELAGVALVFCKNRDSPLLLGSIKSNIGHTEAASGLCSLIKIVVAFEEKWMPLNINCSNVRCDVPALRENKVSVLRETWCTENENYFAANNSGFGGTNSHLLVKKIAKGRRNDLHSSHQLVCISGRTKKSVSDLLESISTNHLNNDYFDLLRYIFRSDIEHFFYRGFIVLSNDTVQFESFKRITMGKPQVRLRFNLKHEDHIKIGKEFSELTVFSNAIQRVSRMFGNNGSDSQSKFLEITAVQIALIDTLQILDIPIDYVEGSFLGLAYATGKLSTEQSTLLTLKFAELSDDDGHIIWTDDSELKLFAKNSQDSSLMEWFFQNVPKESNGLQSISIGFNNKHHVITDLTSFLISVGRLYEAGLNPNLEKLYPRKEWPIKAPIISPSIHWDHNDDWFIPPLSSEIGTEIKLSFETSNEKWAFLLDHCIDGRPLMSGSMMLHLVWQAHTKMNELTNTRTLLENVKWHNPLVLSNSSSIDLSIQICKISKRFVVVHSGELLISGSVKHQQPIEPLDYPQWTKKSENCLHANSFYKLMNLKNYDYRARYFCLDKVSMDGNQALINWKDNWITFMDTAFTMTGMRRNTQDVVVINSIGYLSIDPQVHMDPLETVHFESGTIRSTCAQARGLLSGRTMKRANLDTPILRNYKFVPLESKLETTEAVVVNIALILENIGETPLRVAECNEPLSVQISDLISEFKTTAVSCNVFDVKTMMMKGTNLVIISRALNRIELVRETVTKLKEGDFLLLHEFVEHPLSNFPTISNTVTVSVYHTQRETVLLLQKSPEFQQPRVVRISNDVPPISELETYLGMGEKVVILTEGNPRSGIIGLVNSLRLRYGRCVSCIFITGKAPRFNIEDHFYKEQLKKSLRVNVWNGNKWGTYVSIPIHVEKRKCAHAIGMVKKGSLGHFRWVEGPLRPCSDGLARVHCVGLNFQDAMVATGKINPLFYPEGIEPNSLNLGMEFAGRDLNGGRVMGLVQEAALSNLVQLDTCLTWRVPDEWTLEDAATVPCAYTITLLCLVKLAKIKAGQTILIHGGSGGIGQSAINIATFFNCTIFTTVGSRQKRNTLKRYYPCLQDTHIGNTRDVSFEQFIMKQTDGRGVDVVLNTLPEEKLDASLRCLSPGGKLFDINNTKALKNGVIDLCRLTNNRAFYGVSLHAILNANIGTRRKLGDLVYFGIRMDYVKPLLRLTCDGDRVEEVLRHMSLSNHIGKVVVKLRDEKGADEQLEAIPKFYAHSEKVYILIGGLESFGIEVTDWLVKRGARKLVILSRNVSDDYQEFKIGLWKEYGSMVTVIPYSLEEFDEVVHESSKWGIVDGIFNLSVGEQAPRDVDVLDAISRKFCPNLRYFVVCLPTSTSDHATKCMETAEVQRICEIRQAEGFPALAIQWGPTADLEFSENDGIKFQQKVSSCLQVLDNLLVRNDVFVTVGAPEKIPHYDNDFVSGLSKIIGINPNHISLHSTLSELGMDSITCVEIQKFLKKDFGISQSLSSLKNCTPHSLKAEVGNV